ncbi:MULTISPECIES: antitoxin [unclassified Streptomyces]|uniref:antitoxin n=1 Tax=unclassified Streptomyces TaxID=2593676 RepID=UPI0022B66C58|nr:MULTISPECIES: antitoxin [unclassified Streptomyces]MCZ7416497.1 antitoxin [Streptomyces sp. WMMC897]MCZ7433692.1 antitoxin [Streptomyces sp. WMMC1477]
MSIMDKLKGMLKGHEDQARQGVEKGGDHVDKRTGGRYEKHVDTAQERLDEQLGGEQPRGRGEDRPPEP